MVRAGLHTFASTQPSASPPGPASQTPPNAPPAASGTGPSGAGPPASPPPASNALGPPPIPPPTGSTPPAPGPPTVPPSPGPPSPPPSAPPASPPPPSPPVTTSPPPVLPPPSISPPPASPPPPPHVAPPTVSPPPLSPPATPPPAVSPPPPVPSAPPPGSPPPSPPPPAPVAPPPSIPPKAPPPSPPPAPPPSSPPPPKKGPPPKATPPAPAPIAIPPSVPPPAATPPAVPPPAAAPPAATPPAAAPPVGASPPLASGSPPPPPPPNGAAPPAFLTPGVLSPPVPTAPAVSAPATGPATSPTTFSTTTKVGLAAGGLVGVFFLVALVICFCRKKKRKDVDANGFPYKSSGATVPLTGAQYRTGDVPDAWGMHSGGSDGKIPPPPSGSDNMGNSRSWFTFDELAAATDNYAKENLLGEGGFGRVYKGTLPNGTVVAVKQLTVGGGQGEREFRAEVEVISRVHHRHLVSLVGYCVADRQRLLVYDYVSNGTLEHNLHNKNMPIMDWNTRLKIGLGCARGLAYLHEDCHPRIIHRDIKSSNILLDENFEAQVADFGLAKLSSDTHTHVSTRVMGTFGYLAPEYAASGKLTDRSDVYSFGVVLLELVTGRKPIDTTQPVGDESLVEWARPVMNRVLEDGHLEDLVDPELEGRFDQTEMIRVIETAAACVRHSALKRPRMAQVVRALESDSDRAGLYQGMKPGQSMEYDSQYGSEYGGGTNRYGADSGQFDTEEYNAGLRSFKKPVIGTQQFNLPNIKSGEYALPSIKSGEYAPRSGEYNASHATASSGEYDADTVSDLPGDVRDHSSQPTHSYAAAPRSGQFNPNSGNQAAGYNNRSGFFGQPPPRPANYRPAPFSGEYVPIGKTVQFAPSVDEH